MQIMLMLGFRKGQSVWVGDTLVTVVKTGHGGGEVRLGFEGPRDVPIVRDEVKRRDESAATSAGCWPR